MCAMMPMLRVLLSATCLGMCLAPDFPNDFPRAARYQR
jgi:hypothetical protein